MPTRKFCIRCGASLISAPKHAATPPPAPRPETPEVGRVTTGASVAKARAETSELTPVTDDKWVRPSEVAKDRVRSAAGRRGKSELEKAQEAFARAEEVGIDEEGDGVIETRMLRASEVRELLESSAEMEAELSREMVDSPPIMMEGSEPLSPEAAEMMKPAVPSPKAVEEQILGAQSAFVSKPSKATVPSKPATAPAEAPLPESASEFTSSKYGEASPFAPIEETPTVVATTVRAEPPPTVEEEMDYITACPHCNEVINIDTFEYPKEVYSAMGSARLKQARYFVVQGKPAEAGQVLRIAKALFEKANDEKGKAETQKLVDSLMS
ncbi:MAG: hypothetical protein EAX95_11670 [Candidatus Thorarchaeota archaeon]|nr:hypothetical protein [Candidatus Thorarchaeota archaeon]